MPNFTASTKTRPKLVRASAALAAFFIALAPVPLGEAQESAANPTPSELAALQNELARVREAAEALRAENAALQRENESLRRMLSLLKAADPAAGRTNAIREPSYSPAVGTNRPVTSVPGAIQRGGTSPESAMYWMSTSSGLRHNSRCRYYRNSNGRTCGPNEGKACGICGG